MLFRSNTRWTNATKAANDPCPMGYKVPSKAQWAAVMANNAKGTWATGYQLGNGLFLPASGYRNYSDGSLDFVGSMGQYWSSTVERTYGIFIMFGSLFMGEHNGERASGCSVRCVAE